MSGSLQDISVSVIVPAYNCEEYLSRCLDSLLSQTMCLDEIIVIDDCSKDSTRQVARRYEERHESIHLYSTDSNKGVGEARNLGMTRANGDYIGFVDPDDWVGPSFYNSLVEACLATGAEVSVSSIYLEYGTPVKAMPRNVYERSYVMHGGEALRVFSRSIELDTRLSAIVNNRVYSRRFLEDEEIDFTVSRAGQDNPFSFRVFACAEKVAIVPKVRYHYFQRADSTTHHMSESYIRHYISAFRQLKEDLGAHSQLDAFRNEYYSLCEHGLWFLINQVQKISCEETRCNLAIRIVEEVQNQLDWRELVKRLDLSKAASLFSF